MRSFKEVLNSSREQVLESRKLQINQQKIAILENIKSNLMITCKIKELSAKKQQQVLDILLEYWSPKKGINKAGIKLLEENRMAIDRKSTPETVELFARKEVKDHINEFKSAFVNNNGRLIVKRLQENIESRIGRRIKFEPLFEMASYLVYQKMCEDNK